MNESPVTILLGAKVLLVPNDILPLSIIILPFSKPLFWLTDPVILNEPVICWFPTNVLEPVIANEPVFIGVTPGILVNPLPSPTNEPVNEPEIVPSPLTFRYRESSDDVNWDEPDTTPLGKTRLVNPLPSPTNEPLIVDAVISPLKYVLDELINSWVVSAVIE